MPVGHTACHLTILSCRRGPLPISIFLGTPGRTPDPTWASETGCHAACLLPGGCGSPLSVSSFFKKYIEKQNFAWAHHSLVDLTNRTAIGKGDQIVPDHNRVSTKKYSSCSWCFGLYEVSTSYEVPSPGKKLFHTHTHTYTRMFLQFYYVVSCIILAEQCALTSLLVVFWINNLLICNLQFIEHVKTQLKKTTDQNV